MSQQMACIFYCSCLSVFYETGFLHVQILASIGWLRLSMQIRFQLRAGACTPQAHQRTWYRFMAAEKKSKLGHHRWNHKMKASVWRANSMKCNYHVSVSLSTLVKTFFYRRYRQIVRDKIMLFLSVKWCTKIYSFSHWAHQSDYRMIWHFQGTPSQHDSVS